MADKYIIGELIKKGNFSNINKFIDKNNFCIFAGKIIPLEEAKKPLYISEENILKSINHPNIIKFKESFSDKQNHYIITDYYPNGELFGLQKKRIKFTEIEIKYYTFQMVSALIYLKQNNIIHRDIKPCHFVISDNITLRLCGFHLAAKLKSNENQIKGFAGTPNYVAPEVIKQEYYSFEVDVWSLGITLFFLFTGLAPFTSFDVDETYENIKLGKFSFPNDCDISDIAKDLIQNMLIVDPLKRITIEKIYAHDFFKYGIPNSLPISTLKEPPSKAIYIQIFSSSIYKRGKKRKRSRNFRFKK